MTEYHLHTPVASLPSIEDTLSLIDRADALGYDRAWVPETWGRDAVSTLAAASTRIESIGLGSSILNVYSRSPAVLGQTAATLAELTPTSFRLGIGPSGPAVIEHWHGLEYDRPLRRTRETAEIVRSICNGSVVDFDGDIFELQGFRLRCDPPSPPPAVDLAGLGPKSIELAGFIGDGWHAMLTTREGFSEQLNHLTRGMDKADRDRDAVEVTLGLTCCALEDADRARSLTAGHIAFYTGAMGTFYGRSLARQGFEQEAMDIASAWQSGNRKEAIEIVETELLDELAVAGTPAETVEQLESFAEFDGVDAVAVSFPRGASMEEIESTIDTLAPRD